MASHHLSHHHLYILILKLLFLCKIVISFKIFQAGDLFESPHVFLTLNSEASTGQNDTLLNRLIELNWYNLDVDINPNGWIGLFDFDPNNTQNQSMEKSFKISPNESIYAIRINATEGQVKTPFRHPVIDFKSKNVANFEDNKCLGYWIAYFNSYSEPSDPILTNCLKIYPNWMEDYNDEIGNIPLATLLIPGTHNGGAWKIYEGRPDDINLVIKYSRNHEDDIYTQLFHGIRFFDLRVGFYPLTEERFWINHDTVRIRPFSTVLNDVKKFLNESNEVIFLDIHRFPVGFDSLDDEIVHEELIFEITNQLGELLFNKGSGLSTINEIKERGKSIILSYANEEFVRKYEFLWPAVDHAWGNVNEVEKLFTFLDQKIPEFGCKPNPVFWSSMAELTPTPSDVILRPNFGLRGFAQLINYPVSKWYRNKLWYANSNIVATDYYLGNNIIEMAIKVNSNRANCI